MELVAALAVLSILMIGILNVIVHVEQEHRSWKQTHKHVSIQPLIELLEHDLANARVITHRINHIKITSYNHLDPSKRYATQHPVRIGYRLIKSENQNWLIRTQQRLDLLNAPIDVMLVQGDVLTFALSESDVSIDIPDGVNSDIPPQTEDQTSSESTPEPVDPIQSDLSLIELYLQKQLQSETDTKWQQVNINNLRYLIIQSKDENPICTAIETL